MLSTTKLGLLSVPSLKPGARMDEKSTERLGWKHAWKRRCMLFFTATFWFTLWIIYLSLGSILFVYLEAEHSHAIKVDTRRNIEERLHEIWQVGMEAGLDQRQYPLTNDTRIIQALIQDLAPVIGLEDLYQWDFRGGFHFCLTVVSTIGFGHLTPTTQIGQLMCIFYGAFGIVFNIKVMRVLGAISNNIIYAFYRCLIAMTPKFLRVSWCCPVEKARVAVAINLVESQQTSAPDVSTNYRSNIYDNRSTNLDKKDVPQAKMAWTISGSTRDQSLYPGHVQGVDSLNSMPQSSSRISGGMEKEHPGLESDVTVVPTGVKNHETIKSCVNPQPPVWFVLLTFFLWILLFSYLLRSKFPELEEDGWTYITCVYYLFVMMSTIGFGDVEVGNLAKGRAGALIETVLTVGGLLALTCLLECVVRVLCDKEDTILKSKCFMCCRKRARKE